MSTCFHIHAKHLTHLLWCCCCCYTVRNYHRIINSLRFVLYQNFNYLFILIQSSIVLKLNLTFYSTGLNRFHVIFGNRVWREKFKFNLTNNLYRKVRFQRKDWKWVEIWLIKKSLTRDTYQAWSATPFDPNNSAPVKEVTQQLWGWIECTRVRCTREAGMPIVLHLLLLLHHQTNVIASPGLGGWGKRRLIRFRKIREHGEL